MKVDESYLVGKNKGTVEMYLNIEEIIRTAKKRTSMPFILDMDFYQKMSNLLKNAKKLE